MKKVLIVEDEILARLGLRQLVDWKKLDLELLRSYFFMKNKFC